MAHPSRRKGFRFERELRDAFQEAGLRCVRAWASNGCALTTDDGQPCTSAVDLLIEGKLKAQCKRRKSVANYITPPQGAHISLLREDRGETYAVMPLNLLLRLLTRIYQPKTCKP